MTECLHVTHEWIESCVTRENCTLGIWAGGQLLAKIERNMEVECIRSLARDLDPAKARPKRLSLYDQFFGKSLLGDAVEEHHSYVSGDRLQIDVLNVLKINEQYSFAHRFTSSGHNRPNPALDHAHRSLVSGAEYVRALVLSPKVCAVR